MAGGDGAAEEGRADASPAPARGGAPGGMMAFHFSTDDFRDHERITAWREAFGRTLLKIDVSPQSSDRFQAHARILRSPGIGVIRSWTAGVDMANSPSLISNDDVTLGCVLTSRWSARQLARRTELHPGDGVLMSNSDLGGLTLPETCRFVTFGVSRSAIAPLVPDIGARFGGRVPASNPAFRVLLRYLELAEDDTVAAEPHLSSAFADHVCDLLALALGATRDSAELAQSRGLSAARLQAMKDDIRRSAHNPDLTVHTVAARQGVSLRYVQRAFEESGSTFTQYLAEQRLTAAYKALRRHALSAVPISTIALDCGFSDVSHFNRLFRQRFGCTPSDVRTARPSA
jgi:AraC-like DNA-binding protein